MTQTPPTDDSDASAPAGSKPPDPPDPIDAARALLDSWATNLLSSFDKLRADLHTDARRIRRDGAALGQAMTARLMPLFHAARATPRAARIVREAGIIVSAYRWQDVRARAMNIGTERDAIEQRSAERCYQTCIELRGAVLKLGQFASTRRDLLPPPYVEALARLQDSVPALPFEPIADRIRTELGAPLDELFRSIDAEPLAAASLAQVHAAVLPDGTEVVVKVQVPEVEAQVEGDLALFGLMAGVLRDLAPTVDLVPIAEQLGRSVREELDYRLEAERATRMAEDLAGDPAVRVPCVHPTLSTARVLTLERIHGERLTDFLDRSRSAADQGDAAAADALDAITAALVRTYAEQILRLGRFQADPHPGNFLVSADGRLALLDFGAIETFSPDERRAYAALTGAVVARDRERAAALLADLGFAIRDGGDPAALVDFAELILDVLRPAPDRPLAGLDPRAAFDEALAQARRSPILIPHHFVQLGRVLSSLAGILLTYRPRLDLFSLVAPYLILPTSSAPDVV